MSPDRQTVTRWLFVGLLYSSLLGFYTRIFPAAYIIQGATFALVLIWLLRGGQPALERPFRALGIAWGGFLAVSLLSSLTSLDVGASLAETMRWVSYAMFFLLGARLFRSQGWLRRVAQLLLLLGLFMAGVAIYFYSGDVGVVAQPVMNGSFGNKNHLAGFFGLLLPLSVALYLEAKTPREALAYGATGMVFGVCLFLTYSRGGWFALAPALPLVLWGLRSLPWTTTLLRLAILVVATGAIIPLISGASFGYALGRGSEAVVSVAQASIGAEPEGSLAPRLDYWQGALRIMTDHPLLGTGPGTFQTVFPEYQQDPRYYSKFAHSFPLQAGAEMGLPGLLAALALMVGVGWLILRSLKVAPSQRALALGVAAGIAASIIHNLVELDWYIPALGNLFWAEVGLLGALVSSRPETPDRTRPKGRSSFAILACLFLLLSLLQLAQYAFVQWGDQARSQGDFTGAEASLTWAKRLNPLDGEASFQLGDLYLARYEDLGQELDLERGIAAAQEAVARSPHTPSYRSLLARLYLTGDSPQRPMLSVAVAQLEDITANRPAYSVPYAYQQLGQAYLRLGRLDQAESTYRHLIAGFPQGLESPQPQFGALPLEELTQILAEAHLALGNVAYPRDDLETAATEYELSIALIPRSAPAQANLGLVYYRLGRLVEALPHLEQARGLDPTFVPNYYYLGLTYLGLGRHQEAAAALQEAVARDPTNDEARRLLSSLEIP